MSELCSVSGCGRPAWARTWCKTHYSRWRNHGDPNTTLVRRLPRCCEAPGCSEKPHVRWKRGAALCNRHWQLMYRYGQYEAPPSAPIDPLPLCKVAGCKLEVRSRNAGLCEKHYGRVRRGVPINEDRPVVGRYITPAGYVRVLLHNHPLADSRGQIFEHRLVAYDKHAGLCPPCYWCGAPLAWSSATADHLNEDKADNRPENIVVACNDCNRARGAFVPFLRRMRSEAVGTFIDTIDLIRKKN